MNPQHATKISRFPRLALRHQPETIGITLSEDGVQKGQRHHVHPSASLEVANTVGKRRGQPVILTVRAREMNAAGHAFHVSDNGVWLTDFVPVQFIHFEE